VEELKTALLNEFRRALTDPAGRGTFKTDTFSGDDSTTKFTLTKKPLMYIDSVTIGSATKKLNRDYNLDFGSANNYATITFKTPPIAGTNNISITYKYGNNWIYPNSPNVKAEMPRIGIRRIGGGEASGGVGDKVVFQYPTFRVGIWVRGGKSYTINSKTYTGDKLVDFIEEDIQSQVRNLRDSNKPHNVITMRVEGVVDLDFDQIHKLYRREMTIYVHYQKSY